MGQVAAGSRPENLPISCYDIFPGFDKARLRVRGSCVLLVFYYIFLNLFCGSVNLLVCFLYNVLLWY